MPEGVRSMEGLGRRLNMARTTKGFDAAEDSRNVEGLLCIDVNQRRNAQRPEQSLRSELGKQFLVGSTFVSVPRVANPRAKARQSDLWATCAVNLDSPSS